MKFKKQTKACVVVGNTFSPRTCDAETSESLSSGQPDLQSTLQNIQGYTDKPWLENKQANHKQKNQTNKYAGRTQQLFFYYSLNG